MVFLKVLESFLDETQVAGYSLASLLEYWWIGAIVVGVGAGAAITTGVIKSKADPMGWSKMAKWFVPTIVASSLILGAGASFLPTKAFKNLMTTISGSHVTIIDTPTSRAAAKEAEKNVVVIEEEGLVLLKNEDNALPIKINENNKINVFGSCAFGLYYGNGGSGSFQTDGRYKQFPREATKLEKALVDEGFEYNSNIFNMIWHYYKDNKAVNVKAPTDDEIERKGEIQCGYNKYNYSEIVSSCDPTQYEPPVSVYNTPFDELNGQTLLENALDFSNIALFCISRRGSEDEDMNYSELKLKQNEIDCINMLKENFEKVIILLNVPTVIEAEFLNDSAIDAAIFMGHPGLTGATAVAEAISGTINPSGHLVDTWPYDVKSAPSYQNFGNDTTLSHTGGSTGKFTQYVEGIYVGYRYYVTRGMVDSSYSYEDEVQYSFGHGLSYTTFDKSIREYNINEKDQTISITVEVKNTGSVKGKDVVQIYTHAPYYDGGIEKSWYALSAFVKTNEIEPGKAKNYKLDFSFRDIASWSTENGYYVLEHGDYEFSLRENVWELAKTSSNNKNVVEFNLKNDVEFKTSYQTGKSYENIFAEVERGPASEPLEYLSRSDFNSTWQNTVDIVREAKADYFPGGTSNTTSGRSFNFTDNEINEPLPTTGAKNGLDFMDFKGAEWDDPRWDNLLDQLSIQDMENLVDGGSFATPAISSINKPAAKDYDGPGAAFHSGTGHPSEVILACTWNTDMALLMGKSIGREGAARGLTGWYAPGINTHRSPFGGRNFEYYSEDPLIAGKMAGYTNQGCMEYGVYAYAKHFMCNDQENSRAGVFVWATEQSLREIYGRGFEIYVDMGGIGIMSSFNSIGSWWAGASKPLLTTLLREEWGFHGVVVTDYAGPDYMATNIGLRAGNDLWLNIASVSAADTYNATPHDTTILLRRAAKNILYACANSNNVWTKEDYEAVGIPEGVKATDRS